MLGGSGRSDKPSHAWHGLVKSQSAWPLLTCEAPVAEQETLQADTRLREEGAMCCIRICSNSTAALASVQWRRARRQEEVKVQADQAGKQHLHEQVQVAGDAGVGVRDIVEFGPHKAGRLVVGRDHGHQQRHGHDHHSMPHQRSRTQPGQGVAGHAAQQPGDEQHACRPHPTQQSMAI